jgi:hypothetical protein
VTDDFRQVPEHALEEMVTGALQEREKRRY